MPASFARRSRMRPLRFRPRTNPVDDVASQFGEVLLAFPLPLMASLAHSALSPPVEERSQDSRRKFSTALYFLKSSESAFLLLERLHPVNADFFLTGVAADFSWIGDALTSCLKHPLE
jgi:hypothetical protein